MAGVTFIVTSSQDKGAVVILEEFAVDILLQLDRHKPNRMGGRAGASLEPTDRTDGVHDMVLEVVARDVATIPARREEDNLVKTLGAILLW